MAKENQIAHDNVTTQDDIRKRACRCDAGQTTACDEREHTTVCDERQRTVCYERELIISCHVSFARSHKRHTTVCDERLSVMRGSRPHMSQLIVRRHLMQGVCGMMQGA